MASDVQLVVESTRQASLEIGVQGPRGTDGGTLYLIAATPISGERVITTNANGKAIYADAATLAHAGRIAGISQSATSTGHIVSVQQAGEMTYSGWSWTAGALLFCGANGVITATVPDASASVFSQTIGFAKTATTIVIEIGTAIQIANEPMSITRLQSIAALTSGAASYAPLSGISAGGAALASATPFFSDSLPTQFGFTVVLDVAPGGTDAVTLDLYDVTAAAIVTGVQLSITGAATSGTLSMTSCAIVAGHLYCWQCTSSATSAASNAFIGAECN